MRILLAAAAALVVVVVRPAPLLADGGPDEFGYTFTDSLSGSATFEWQEISDDPLAALWTLEDDDVSDPIDLEFPFSFYGRPVDRVWVHSNGFVTFDEIESDDYFDVTFACPLPSPGNVDGAIYFFMRDWDPSGGGTIHTATVGTEPERSFIVQFTDVMRLSRRSGLVDPMTIQLVLDEGTNAIRVEALETGSREGGDGAIGIEAPAGMTGLSTVCRGEGALPDDSAVEFHYPAGELTTMPRRRPLYGLPGAEVSGTIEVFNLSDGPVAADVTTTGVWPMTTDPSPTLDLPARGSAVLTIGVTIPEDATAGDAILASVSVAAAESLEIAVPVGVQRASQGPWQTLPAPPRGATDMLVAVSDDSIWTAGGMVLALWDEAIDVLARYDLRRDRWTSSQDGQLAPLPDGRRRSAGCVLGGRLYVIGGLDRPDDASALVTSETTFVYDIATDTWSEAEPLPDPRASATAVCDEDGGRIFVLGGVADLGDFGQQGEPRDDIQVFDGAAGTWTAAGTLPRSRMKPVAILWPPGSILLVSGALALEDVTLVDVYDIEDETFAPAPALPALRSGVVGGLLDDVPCLASGAGVFGLETDWLCLGDGQWIPQIDLLPMPEVPVLPEGGGVGGGRLYVLGGTGTFQQEPNPLVRWPQAPLADGDADADADAGADAGAETDAGGDADADSDADTDADADGDGDADSGADAGTVSGGGVTGGGACGVTPGRSAPGAGALLAATLLGLALRRRR